MAVHPAALVLAEHTYHAQTRGADGLHTKGACECREWRGWIFDHPEHLADMLDRAGLLADGTPPETPTTRVPRREGRQEERVSIPDLIANMAAKAARTRAEAIEKACEMAVAGGEFGVSVYEDVALVDPEVPYGRIHYHQCRRDERRY